MPPLQRVEPFMVDGVPVGNFIILVVVDRDLKDRFACG